MNEDDNNLKPWIEPELEARVVAWVLGEASAFEVAELERLVAEQPELALFKKRIEAVHGLVAAAARPADPGLRLDAERRRKLLEVIGVSASGSKSKVSLFPWRPAWLTSGLLLRVAACLVVGLIVVTFFSSVSFVQEKASSRRFAAQSAMADAGAIDEESLLQHQLPAGLAGQASGSIFQRGGENGIPVGASASTSRTAPLDLPVEVPASAGKLGGDSQNESPKIVTRGQAQFLRGAIVENRIEESDSAAMSDLEALSPELRADEVMSMQPGKSEASALAGASFDASAADRIRTEVDAKSFDDSAAEAFGGAAPATAATESVGDSFAKTVTPMSVKQREKNAELIVQASDYYSSGRYDLATKRYEQIINDDPYNIAARRGLEKINDARSQSEGKVYNETRSVMAQASSGSALPMTRFSGGKSQSAATSGSSPNIQRKLDEIRIPAINFREATVREALDYLKLRAAALDRNEPDPNKRGLNILLKLDPSLPEMANQRLSLQLKDVPLREALAYVAAAASLKVKIEPYAVAIVPLAEATNELVTKEYKVSPELMASFPEPAPSAAFGGAGGTVGKSRAKEFLEASGVVFPPGATANYLSSSGKLIVRNTQDNLDLIDSFTDADQLSLPAESPPVDLMSAPTVATTSGRKAVVSVIREFKYPAEPDSPLPAAATAVRKKQAISDELTTSVQPFSTFSLHVADVSFLLGKDVLEKGGTPDPEDIRTEEFYNAFDYSDPAPAKGEEVAARVEQSAHPFLQQRNLVRISMKVASAGRNANQPLRLTILLDTSGSMEREDRAASVRRALASLASLLGPNDRVTLVGFARQPRLLAEELPGDQAGKLVEIAARTPSDGGTNLEEALALATELAVKQRVPSAQNRVVLLTDGAANLGNADPAQLAKRIEKLRQQGIAFDACGVGATGLNDGVLEALTRKGDGRYYFLNQPADADAGFARQLAGAFRPAAENVKVQVRFNPARVGKYKLLGFEEHRLKKQDFRNDKVDAAELSAEEAGVAVYQVEPLPDGDGDLGEVLIRFRDPATKAMVERSWTIPYEAHAPAFDQASPSMQLAGVAAMLAEKLRGGPAAEAVELKALAPVINQLRSDYPEQARVRELIRMFELMTR